MLTCENCGKSFDTKFVIDGKVRYNYDRKYCRECLPFPSQGCYSLRHNKNEKTCSVCQQKLPRSAFYTYAFNNKRKDCKSKPYQTSRCKNCSRQFFNDKRKIAKEMLVEYKGGKCEKCGYNKCISVLQFHHRDPSIKDFELSTKTQCSHDKLRKEADKCDMLCANCHQEIHYESDQPLLRIGRGQLII